jgi:hypothetical protein
MPFVGAWVAKAITLRVGGSKTYSNYGIPVASGLLTGMTLSTPVDGGIGIFRFFFQF